jgi:hypothetical protein
MGVTIIDLMSDEDIIVIKDEHEEKEKKQANSYAEKPSLSANSSTSKTLDMARPMPR